MTNVFNAMPIDSPLVAPPSDVLLAMYTPIIQAFLDGGPVSGPLPSEAAAVGGRDPVQEEKIRLLLISSLTFWMLVSQNAATKQRIGNAIAVLSDPTQWATIANLIWGPIAAPVHTP